VQKLWRKNVKTFEDLQFGEFREADAKVFTEIMKRSFDKDAKRHLNEEFGGLPGYDNIVRIENPENKYEEGYFVAK
jgi:hypothetical protein